MDGGWQNVSSGINLCLTRLTVETGQWIWVSAGRMFMVASSTESCGGDAGNRREWDESLDEKLRSLERQAGLGRISAEMVHELSTPLTTIACHVHELLRRMSPGDERRRIEAIRRAVERSLTIVRYGLGLVRGGAMSFALVDVNGLVEAILALKSYSVADRRFEFSTELGEGLALVMGDFNRLLQVLLNLVANAERAVRSGERVREVSVFTRMAGNRVQFGVRDTGPGIAEKLHSRIFEALFTTYVEEGGTGIGLWVSRSIVEDHGGVIMVSSEEGEGTTFTVELPAASGNSD